MALDRSKNIDQYGHDVWTAQNGLPGQAVYQILQTPDGYLWLRTSAGLVRFDGARFILMELAVANQPLREEVSVIGKTADGNLLVRTATRTLIRRNGAFFDYIPATTLLEGDPRSILESRKRELIVGTTGGVEAYHGHGLDQLRSYTGTITSLLEDSAGTVWACGAREIFYYRGGKVADFPWTWKADHPSPSVIAEDVDHSLLVGTFNGVYRIDRTRTKLLPVAPKTLHGLVTAIHVDHDGNVWVATRNSGLYRLQGGRATHYDAVDGLADNTVFSLQEDREGGLWVGTATGLEHFRDTLITTYTTKDGLLSNQADLVTEGRDGSLYIFCQAGGLVRIKNGVMTSFTQKDGMANIFGNGLFESRDGSLWVGTGGGLSRFKNGKFTAYPGDGHFVKPDISAINEDDESLIVTNNESATLRFRNGKVTPYTVPGGAEFFSNSKNYTFTIYKDSQGTMWFGNTAGLYKYAKGGPLQRIVDSIVVTMMEDRRGNLWFGGLFPGVMRYRLRDGHITRFAKKEGLFDERATTVLVDEDDNLWASNSNGIYMVPRQDLEDYGESRLASVRAAHYGIEDGMKTSESSMSGHQPSGVRTRDGRLWFATAKGVVVIDPRHLRHNSLVPPVVLEEVLVDGVTVPAENGFVLRPGSKKLEFHYTALSLQIPDRVHFKYQLEGYDQDWVDAGSQRVAYYTNLPPGKYRFRVIASNNDGLWNFEGAAEEIYLQPRFYQTLWFYCLCVLIALLAALAGQRFYTRHLRRRAVELARIVRERTRDLESQRTFLRNVIDISPDLIYVKDRAGRFVLVNKTISIIHDIPVEKLIGMTISDLGLPPEAVANYELADTEVFATQKEKVLDEQRVVDVRGQSRWLQTTKRPIPSPDGKDVFLLGVGMDVTERKNREQQLRLQAAALEAAANAIVIMDSSGKKIIWVNPAFTKMTGYTPEETIDRSPNFFHSDRQSQSFYEEAWRKLRSGEIWSGEVVNQRKNGELYNEEMVITPVRDERGEIAHFIAIKQDVTEKKELEHQLMQAQKMDAVGKLAGGIAHDFNNMMQVILGQIDILRRQIATGDPNHKRLEQIRQAAMRSASLTRQLLAFSRRQVLQPVIMDLNATVADMKKMLSRLISEDIQMDTILQPGLGHVKADPTQIEQILMNLVVNARDAMPHGGMLTIETANVELGDECLRLHSEVKPGSYVKLEVRDTGVGIEKGLQTRIFEPFFTTKELGKGTGLGLSMVYGIVKQSGGYIWADSEPGKGTAFQIHLPRIDAAVDIGPEGKTSKMARGTETILVVEDNTAILDLVRESLAASGYRVLAIRSPLEAIHYVNTHEKPVALLVTDVVMPEMSGPAMAEKMMEVWPAMRVIYMSGYTNDIILRHGVRDSGRGFLQKPFSTEVLAAKIREILDEPSE